MTLQDLTRLVSLGEGPYLEFKRKSPQPERIAKEIIAFANTRGGRLLLGIDDDGTIHGVRDAEEEEYALHVSLERHSRPIVPVETERVAVSRKRDVIVVVVHESSEKPHFMINNGSVSKTAYVRVEDMSIEASREKVRLMRAETRPRDVKFTFGDNELMLMRYLERYGRITVAQFASLAHISRRRASQTLVLMTRARVLALHVHPKQDYFTLARAQTP